MSFIVEYIKAISSLTEQYREYYNWILQNLKLWDGSNRDEDKEKELINNGFIKVELRQCYYQSQIFSLIYDDYEYYEGWYIVKDFAVPIEHAFLVHNDKVVDVTARRAGLDVLEYGGVHIPRKFVLDYVIKHKECVDLLPRYYLSRKDASSNC